MTALCLTNLLSMSARAYGITACAFCKADFAALLYLDATVRTEQQNFLLPQNPGQLERSWHAIAMPGYMITR